MASDAGGRVVVVSGANEGIGHHLTRALLADGDRVAALDVAVDGLEELAESYPERLLVRLCDLRVDADVEAAVSAVLERWDHVDVLVNNAGIFRFGLFADRTLADTETEFAVNVFGTLRLTHAVLPHMRERESGIVHVMGSGVSRVGNPGLSGYAASKGALESFMRSLRLELQDEPGVDVTLMFPPLTATRSAKRLGYGAGMMQEPASVGRTLADKLEHRGPVVWADRTTRIGIWVAERVPWLVERGTRRFLEDDGVER